MCTEPRVPNCSGCPTKMNPHAGLALVPCPLAAKVVESRGPLSLWDPWSLALETPPGHSSYSYSQLVSLAQAWGLCCLVPGAATALHLPSTLGPAMVPCPGPVPLRSWSCHMSHLLACPGQQPVNVLSSVWSCSLHEDRPAAGRHATVLLHPPGFRFQPPDFPFVDVLFGPISNWPLSLSILLFP